MDKNAIWKWLILAALISTSLWIVTPFEQKVRYGLDLAGGTRYVLEVDTANLESDVARDAQPRALEVIRNRIDALGGLEPVIYTEPNNRIIVEIPGMEPEQRARTLKTIQSAAFLEFRMVHAKNDELVEDLFAKGEAPEGYKIVTVDDIRSGGAWQYKQYLKRDQEKDPEGVSEEQIRERSRAFRSPSGHEMLLELEVQNNQRLYRPTYVSKRRELTGESLSNAGIDYDNLMRPYVTLRFNASGAKRFANLTADYAPGGAKNPNPQSRRQLAIVLDGTLYSAPSIREAIYGGSAQITGSFSVKDAQDLAIVLRAGALPAPVKLLEERTVAPTLGAASVQSGRMATLLGVGEVMVFMVIYYTLAGAIANVALLLNLLLLPVGLIIVSGIYSVFASPGTAGQLSLPTLTLPGIAGIALTIGMAVDANVLIYERMREEQAAGKRLRSVVDAGYDKAFSAIFDSNITTLLSAAILFWQGTGPVRGYAITLSAGILVSMYTALVCTRMLFDLLSSKTKLESLKMMSLFKAPSIDFLAKKTVCAILSLLVIGTTWVGFISRGEKNFGVDFVGGTAVAYAFDQKVSLEKVSETLVAAGLPGSAAQYQSVGASEGAGTSGEELELKVPFEKGPVATEALAAAFPEANFKVIKEDSVGPQIGKELQRRAIMATLLSLVGIIIYVSLRFEFPFAAGAVVALLHDVLVAVGVYCMMGKQLSVSMVAALLTIIGYSVNDTIVIFDRIRENMKLYPGRKLAVVANEAINQTLSRTLLTSFATMLTVVALLAFGGGSIQDFTLLLFIGMISGVYSTVYVATPVVLLWHREKPNDQAAPSKA